jgi:hypothetical protein
MLRVGRRIERLEEELLPPPDAGPPEVLTLCFVDSEKNVVDTLEFPLGQVRPSNGRRKRTGGRAGERRGLQ